MWGGVFFVQNQALTVNRRFSVLSRILWGFLLWLIVGGSCSFLQDVAFGASPPPSASSQTPDQASPPTSMNGQTVAQPSSAGAPPVPPQENDCDDPVKGPGGNEPYACETGKVGLSIMLQYNILQTPAPIKLFESGVGGDGEVSYGVSRGIRLLGGFGYIANTPHISPPLTQKSSSSPGGPSNQYAQAYLGGQLELTRWIPQMIRYQPWFPYVRADVGGVFASISDAGAQSGHPDGLLADAGIGIEGRPRAMPMAFFGEIRSQWFFLGPQTLTVIPVLAGTTFYF